MARWKKVLAGTVIAGLVAFAVFLFGVRSGPWSARRALPDGKVAPQIAFGAWAGYLLCPDGSLWGWGYFTPATKLVPGLMASEEPRRVGQDSDWLRVAAGRGCALAIKQDGSLWAWGENEQGQSGQPRSVPFLDSPRRIGRDTNWVEISTAGTCSLALKRDGSMWSWGGNKHRLADGSEDFHYAPEMVGPDRDWTQISAGLRRHYAIKRDGTVWGWWCNNFLKTDTPTPQQIATNSGWVAISAGKDLANLAFALRADGTLWVLGAGRGKPAWLESVVTEDFPGRARIGFEANWREIHAGADNCFFGTRSDGSCWAFGENRSGRLGLGESESGVFPLRRLALGGEPWAFGPGSRTTSLLARDGTLWTWGLRLGADKTRILETVREYRDKVQKLLTGRRAQSRHNDAVEDLLPRRLWEFPGEMRRALVANSPKRGDAIGSLAPAGKAIAVLTNLVKASLDDALEYHYRGEAKAAKGDFAGAIKDYTAAIAINPDYGYAYHDRGLAKYSVGDMDGAVMDGNKAVELQPEVARGYRLRGNAKKGKKDFDGAIADYSKAIELGIKRGSTYHDRGCLRYDARDFAEALADFRKAIDLESNDDYYRFRIWLIRARLGDAEAATAELDTYLTRRATGKSADWASQVGRFLAGRITESQFLAAAKSADPETETGQLCEAYFYSGSKRLLAGEKAGALDLFQKCLATGRSDFIEHTSASAETRYLKAR
jgi:lipoprotein NlpI/alpha-tubulin suppressor-like RCC1 family protein